MEALGDGGRRAYTVHAKDVLQGVAVVGHDAAPIDQAHAIRSRPARRGILYPLSELADGGCGGEVGEGDAALDLGRRRQDPEGEGRGLFGHGGGLAGGDEVVRRVGGTRLAWAWEEEEEATQPVSGCLARTHARATAVGCWDGDRGGERSCGLAATGRGGAWRTASWSEKIGSYAPRTCMCMCMYATVVGCPRPALRESSRRPSLAQVRHWLAKRKTRPSLTPTHLNLQRTLSRLLCCGLIPRME